MPSSPDTEIAPTSNKQYVEITPRWQFTDLGIDFVSDIFVAKDGRFFIADSVNNNLIVIRQSGKPADNNYDVLKNPVINSETISPTAVCVDPRFIVYFVDGNDKIYAWNQFVSQTGIAGIIDSMKYTNGTDTIITTPLQSLELESYTSLKNTEFIDTNSTLLDSITSPYIFYDPNSPKNIQVNPSYATKIKKFITLAPSSSDDKFIFAMDKYNNKLAKIDLIPSEFVSLENGQSIWTYEGVLNDFVAEEGTGGGTINNPTGMTSDNDGNLYYTQLGNYFGLHKLLSVTYNCVFNKDNHEIMQLDQFQSAIDVAADDDASIFVLDSAANLVKKFTSNGVFDKFVGVSNNWIRQPDTNVTIFIDSTEIINGDDTTYTTIYDTTTTIKDTLFLEFENDVLNSATAIAEYEDVIYISDTGNRRILRYTLSTDVNIQDPDQ
ncbi:MAG: hypothetical protein U9R41_08540 [Candidatus Marinimicrobia bacterium]|nr:hypothetical protein [Candidatus Neomarinimicrobiota bacterium]